MTMESSKSQIFPDLALDEQKLLQIEKSSNLNEICGSFLEFLDYFENAEIIAITQPQLDFINRFIEFFLSAFEREDFHIPPEFADKFINSNVVVSNLVRVTRFMNTNNSLAKIFPQQNNVIKILTLLSHRNTVDIDINSIFKAFPHYASVWWGNIISYAWNSNNPPVFENLKNWSSSDALGENLRISEEKSNQTIKPVFDSYFQSTYIYEGADKKIRNAINSAVKKTVTGNYRIANPDFKKLAVISMNFYKNHAVYRSISPYLHSLKGHYHLTLIHFGKKIPGMDFDNELFDEIKIIDQSKSLAEDIKHIMQGNYGIIYYPDIGMNIPSIMLSNCRIAPVQITGSGHPVSTFGSEIDFFICGRDIEDLRQIEQNYSEKIILIPGMGMVPVYPEYKLKNLSKPDNRVHILCNWGSNKIYYPHLKNLQKIIKQAEQKIVLHFTGIHARKFNFLPGAHELREQLVAENCEVNVYTGMAYEKYMEIVEKCDFALDSYPFGGYNRVIDMIFCHKPAVAIKGNKSYNRVAAKIIEEVGLKELVAENFGQYVSIAAKLINDSVYRSKMAEILKNAEIKSKIFNTRQEIYFKKAVDFLVQNHQKLKEDKKIVEIN